MSPSDPPQREKEDKEVAEERKPKSKKRKADKKFNTFSMDEEYLAVLREALQEALQEILQDIDRW